jgi:hypothetical protein
MALTASLSSRVAMRIAINPFVFDGIGSAIFEVP